MYFVTGNPDKLREVQAFIPSIKQLQLDLLEIQTLDPKQLIHEKLKEALSQVKEECIVEDTSLYLGGLNGLPGPLVKWFEKSIGLAGIVKMAQELGDGTATAIVMIGYAKDPKNIHFFEGSVTGHIVQERGTNGFGWDTIFQPNGHSRTFAEMSSPEKNNLSMRRIATIQLKEFLEK